MRLHTDKITEDDLTRAAEYADVQVTYTVHGSRSRTRAFEVRLIGSGPTGGAYGTHSDPVGTWDEWGIFLAQLYRIDVEMTAGPYRHNREDDYESFDFLTDDRYGDLRPADQHKRHKWHPLGAQPTYCFVPGTVRSYAGSECDCGAVRHWILDYIGEDGQPTRQRPARMMGDPS